MSGAEAMAIPHAIPASCLDLDSVCVTTQILMSVDDAGSCLSPEIHISLIHHYQPAGIRIEDAFHVRQRQRSACGSIGIADQNPPDIAGKASAVLLHIEGKILFQRKQVIGHLEQRRIDG